MEASEPKEMKQPVKQDMEDHAAAEEKSVIPVPEKLTTEEPVKEKSANRDSALARVETEKRLALVKAWEENEKAKVDNKAHKKISAIESWDNTKKAAVEAQLRSFEEKLEKKKAEYAEKMKNKVAELHKEAEEKKAMIEAKKGEEFLKIEETAAKYRSTGYTPNKFLACFST
ncbi:remorin 1.4-like isoform X2 [Hibiscus syriacus]|uniref:remorin 1.4-like isoform X1 n=1 Tax=Hibiscus syriacus TaxID=106335 RepID=UPI001922189F|nr:remorin 1.4-like isoform X1 [Hibiscus syriacus]XP_039051926.1 remorin 1.4-like isoform X2 [Hibiscus syriacus]